jgi:hypothetical protein
MVNLKSIKKWKNLYLIPPLNIQREVKIGCKRSKIIDPTNS